GEAGTSDVRSARLKEKQSLLDSVSGETNRLKSRLGAADRVILDEYLSNIHEVEQQLERMKRRLGTLTGVPDAPVGLPEAFDDHMSITYNLMHLALQGDISRVFTFMVGHEPTDRSNPPALLIGGAHGKLKGDRHIVAKKEPTANLLLGIAHLYGAQIDNFGASTGRLDL